LQLLPEPPGTDEDAEKEGDMTVVSDLADDLRDAIVEYQVSADTQNTSRAVHSYSS